MKKGEVNWVVVGMILALIVLFILIIVFREQILGVAKNFGILTPNTSVVSNVSNCLTDPSAPGCNQLMNS